MMKWAGVVLLCLMILSGISIHPPVQAQDNATALRRIEAAYDTRPRELDLSWLGLTTLPPQLLNLTWLETLNLSGNEFTELPPEVYQLPRLQTLYLAHTTFSTLSPEINQLTSLQELYLVGATLSSLPPEIGQLTNLRELHLNGSMLSSLPPEIGQLDNLIYLDLSNTPLTALPPEIGQLSGLRTLYLTQSLLTTLPPEIGQLTGLTALNLETTTITHLPPEIGQLVNLERLYLDNSALTELPTEIGQLTKLEWLHMEGTPISELPPDIGQWVNLEWLDLSRTQLRTLPPEIGQWVNLQQLHLNGTKLTALPPEIGNLVNLRELHLYDIGTMTLPPEIGQLTQLSRLSLTNTSITVLPPEIGQLTQLESLELGFTSLIRLPPEIGRLTQLHTLNLTANPIYTLPPEIGQLINLRELYLSRTQISELPPEFYHLTALRGLYLSATPIRELSPDIAQLTQLVRLTLKDTAIEELPRDFLLLIPNVYQFEYNGRWVNTSPRLTSEDMENRVEIVWQTFSCETTPYQYQELLVDEFNHQQTEIKLTLACINFGQYDPQYRFQQYVDMGEGIDIVGLTSTSFANHFHGQWLDLQPLIDATGYDLSQFSPNIIESYRSDGGLRGIPFSVYPGVLFYNVDLFDAAGLNYPPTVAGDPYIMPDGTAIPWDYDAVIQVGQLLTLDTVGHNATHPDFDPENIVQYGFDHQWGNTLFDFHTFGGFSLLNDDNQVVIPEPWRAQAHWEWDSVWTYHISPTYADYMNEPLSSNSFESGHLAMARSALWYLCCIDKLTARWDLAIQPAYQGQIYAPADMEGFHIHQSTRHPEEAFTVLRYLTDDVGAELTGLYDIFPARTDLQPAGLAPLAAKFPKVQHWDVLLESVPLAPITHDQQWFPNRERPYPEVSGESRLYDFWTLLRGDTGASLDVDAELDKLQADLQAIVDTP